MVPTPSRGASMRPEALPRQTEMLALIAEGPPVRRVLGVGLLFRTAVAAPGDTPVIDGAAQEDCISIEGGARAERGRQPRERWHLPADLAAMGRAVAGLDNGRGVLEGPFAKMEMKAWVESCQYSSDIENYP